MVCRSSRAANGQASKHGPPLETPAVGKMSLLRASVGVIRSHAAAVVLLREAGAGKAANPRILLDLAAWCGLDEPVQAITVGARSENLFVVYVRQRADVGPGPGRRPESPAALGHRICRCATTVCVAAKESNALRSGSTATGICCSPQASPTLPQIVVCCCADE